MPADTLCSVHAGDEVKLAGSGAGGAGTLHYAWSWVSSPYARLEGADTTTPHFVAPKVSEPALVTLALRVDDGTFLSPASIVTVTVRPAGGCGSAGGTSGGAGELMLVAGVLAHLVRRRRRLRRSGSIFRTAANTEGGVSSCAQGGSRSPQERRGPAPASCFRALALRCGAHETCISTVSCCCLALYGSSSSRSSSP